MADELKNEKKLAGGFRAHTSGRWLPPFGGEAGGCGWERGFKC